MIKIAIVGATGMVGGKMLELLSNEYKVKNSKLFLFSSEKSAGKKIKVNNVEYVCITLNQENLEIMRPNFVLFAAGGDISKQFIPIVKKLGGISIDNSSAFRMDENTPLVVPEVNKYVLDDPRYNVQGVPLVIANPNCSTIQSVVVLKPLEDAFSIKRVIFSTYQAVSGSGKDGIKDFEITKEGKINEFYPHPIYNNLIPHIDVFLENGYTKEEEKMINETRKILGKQDLAITATTVRVPILNCHSVSMNIEFKNDITIEQVKNVLENAEKENKGLVVVDDVQNNVYPMPMIADNKDPVYVGRIRMDSSRQNTINLFCVADNVRKGAATNAVQIMHHIINNANS
ncbi:MAG: aspartate-semialdehyde dehydrogenase [Firmicutes bacterium]|nr:aspartate-semialdehyde dehydrogenase [Bacillota bacterium]